MTPKEFNNFMNIVINELGLTNRNKNLRKKIMARIEFGNNCLKTPPQKTDLPKSLMS